MTPERSDREDLGPESRRRHTQDIALSAAEHDTFWRRSFGSRPYTREERGYEHYRPAYAFGWEARRSHGDRPFEEVEPRLKEEWDPDATRLAWEEARPAVRDAYIRDEGTEPSRDEGADNTDTSTPGNPLA